MYKIEKGIPVLPIHRGTAKYPFHDMEINDSVLLPKTSASYAAAHDYSKNGKKFIARAVEGGVRVWRIK